MTLRSLNNKIPNFWLEWLDLVSILFLQLYNEELNDLLSACNKKDGVQIREDIQGGIKVTLLVTATTQYNIEVGFAAKKRLEQSLKRPSD